MQIDYVPYPKNVDQPTTLCTELEVSLHWE